MPHANPIIGYYKYTADKERRNKLVANRAPRGRINKPAQNICDIKYRQVTPTDWRHDPYLVCLLMSLAQLQKRHALAAPKGPFPVNIFSVPAIPDIFTNLVFPRHASSSRTWPMLPMRTSTRRIFRASSSKVWIVLPAPSKTSSFRLSTS